MIKQEYYKTRDDGVKLYKTYSDITPTIKQLPTNITYNCWVFKKNGEVDWELSGVTDVENTPYTYEEVIEDDKSENN